MEVEPWSKRSIYLGWAEGNYYLMWLDLFQILSLISKSILRRWFQKEYLSRQNIDVAIKVQVVQYCLFKRYS